MVTAKVTPWRCFQPGRHCPIAESSAEGGQGSPAVVTNDHRPTLAEAGDKRQLKQGPALVSNEDGKTFPKRGAVVSNDRTTRSPRRGAFLLLVRVDGVSV